MRATGIVEALTVGAGGFVGSVLRWACSGLVYRAVPSARLPWGTLAVNVVGCLAIGLLAGFVEVRQALGPRTRLFLMVGMLGGFTTFSTFGYETTRLLQDGERVAATTNVLLHVAVGLAAVWAGYTLSRLWGAG